MPVNLNYIADGVHSLYLPNSSFKTTYVSVNFYLPLKAETVAQYALLTELLMSCSKEYPDYLLLNYRLSSLYGADAVSSVTKVGDCLCIKFSASCINDRFAFGGENVTKETVNLLLDLIFRPKVKDGAFYEEDMKREKRKLIDRIMGELNEKRAYARNRLVAEMFEGDPYGVYKFGKAEDVDAVTPRQLYEAWKTMIETSHIRIHTIGENEYTEIYAKVKEEISSFNRHNITDIYSCSVLGERESVKRVTEKMDVAQGKLVMGFNVEGGDDDNSLDVMMMCDIFGGGPYGRLFTNVREKMSLCYYCSASSVRNKGFMMVDSGVEKENAERAEKAILEQLQIMKEGQFTDFEFASSLKNLKDSLKTYHDSQSGLDVWYTLKAINKNMYSPEEIEEMLGDITPEAVKKAAQKCRYNTVYMLLPEEREEN